MLCVVPLGRRAIPGACAALCCRPSALCGVACGHPEGGCECHPSACFLHWGSLLSRQSPGCCLTGSHANTVLVWSVLSASLDILSLVGMTLGVF